MFLEPSCLSAVREDAPSLLRGDAARRARVVAGACVLFEEYLEREWQAGRWRCRSRPGPSTVLLHGHCHQKSMGLVAPARALLSRIPSCTVVDLDAGCCGMAGSFGYAREHYDVSRLIGERRLLPAARALEDGAVLVAAGTSCRQQVARFHRRERAAPRPASPIAHVNPMKLKRPSATGIVLGLLCLMYLITYVDRVNVATAGDAIRRELSLSNTQLGLVFSAFAYPYLLFQVFGGWVGDRFGPRLTLFVCGAIWAAATILTGLAGSLMVLLLVRVLLGLGEGATFPVATRAMQSWTPPGAPRLRAGHHARLRALRQRADAADRRVADRARDLARIVRRARRREPRLGGGVGLVLPRQPGGPSGHHEGGARPAARARRGEPPSAPKCRGDR